MFRFSRIRQYVLFPICAIALHSAPARAQDITAQPLSLDLGVCKPRSIRVAQLELSNAAAEPIEVLVSTGGGSFSVKPDTVTILSGSSKTLLVEFSAPAAVGSYNGTVVVEVKKLLGSDKISVPLTASVIQPRLQIVPDPSVGFLFGPTPIADTDRRTLLLSNPSPVTIIIDSLYFESGSGPLEVDASGPIELAAGAQVSIDLTYSPRSGGETRTRLMILSADLDPPHLALEIAATGLAPVVAVSPLPEIGVEFDLTEVGQRTRRRVTVLNKGQSRLVVEGLGVDGPGFSLEGDRDTIAVAPGQRQSLDLAFAPLHEGPVAGSLRFGTNDPDAAHIEMPLAGRASISPARIEVLNEPIIEFGRVAMGKSARDHLLLWNRGGSPFTVQLELEGIEFAIGSQAVLLQPGQSDKVELTFSPESVGRQQASLAVITEKDRRLLELRGTGEYLKLSPSVEDFGRVPVGEAANTVIELTNVGNADFTITRMTSSSEEFTIYTEVSPQNESILAAEAMRSLPLNVSFSPASRGLSTGVLRIEGFWSDGTETFEVLLNGTGVAAEIELHPSGTLDFDYVVLGETQERSLVATNTGDTLLQVEASPLTREADVEPASFSLQPGESTKLTVSFHPETLGDRFGQILLVSNDVRDRAQPIKIQGHGALRAIDLTSITTVKASRKSTTTTLPVDWTNTPVVVQEATRLDLQFHLPDSLRAALVGRKIEVEWVELDDDYDPKGGSKHVEVLIYDDESGVAIAEDLNLRLSEHSIRRIRLRITTRSYPDAPPHSVSQIFEVGGWIWEFEAKPLVSFLTVRPSRDYKDADGNTVKGKTERLIGLPGIAFAGWHNTESTSLSGVHLTATGNVLEALSTDNAIAVSMGIALSLYKDRFLLGFGWDIYDSRPLARRKGTQDYIMTIKYSGLF
jgi:hypothetical protein